MTTKPKLQPDVFTGHERFVYLLTELELIVGSGAVNWTATSVIAARDRVDRIAEAIHELVTRIKHES